MRSFTIESLDYYVRNTSLHQTYGFTEAGFSTIEKFLDSDMASTLSRRLFTSMAPRNPSSFENSLLSFLFPFEQLSFLLTK